MFTSPTASRQNAATATAESEPQLPSTGIVVAAARLSVLFGPLRTVELPVEQMPDAHRTHGYDLAVTLDCGQSFCWRPVDAQRTGWIGWAGAVPCIVSQHTAGQPLRVTAPVSAIGQSDITPAALVDYFQTQTPYAPLFATFPDSRRDTNLAKAMAYCGGMRILKQPAWETTASFICSAQKQIVQIMQINSSLRRSYAAAAADAAAAVSSASSSAQAQIEDALHFQHLHAFPEATLLATAGEAELRLCKLGFRAKHLHRTALQIAAADPALPDLAEISGLTLMDAVERFTRFHGVGEKVASCILLFAYQRMDAFPVDVWVQRILSDLYIPKKADQNPVYIRQFAASYFGPNAGVAQQVLFHWYRNGAPGQDASVTQTKTS
ncbi:MAG: DNA-3-methyladenine glycosylase [Candidatus Methylacidiphilales bacterium]